ncbi:hypothetical protein ACLM5H_23075 [Fredinandcohnia humi]
MATPNKSTAFTNIASLLCYYFNHLYWFAYIFSFQKKLEFYRYNSSSIGFQIGIGVITIIDYISIPWSVLHLTAGTALFGVIVEAWATLLLTSTKIKQSD